MVLYIDLFNFYLIFGIFCKNNTCFIIFIKQKNTYKICNIQFVKKLINLYIFTNHMFTKQYNILS